MYLVIDRWILTAQYLNQVHWCVLENVTLIFSCAQGYFTQWNKIMDSKFRLFNEGILMKMILYWKFKTIKFIPDTYFSL